MKPRSVVASLLALLLARPALPQQAIPSAPSTPPTFAVSTESVVLDVVVRDKKGRMVRDLRAPEFEVFEDGVRQTIDQFMIVSREPEPGPAEVADAAPATPGAPAPAETAPLVTPTTAEALGSVIALVFDRLSADARNTAYKAARSYYDRERRQDDLVGIFSIDLALHTLQPFTADTDRIRDGIERALGQASASFTASLAEAQEARRLQSDVDQASNALTSAQSTVSGGGVGAGAGIAAQAQGLAARSEALNAAEVTLRMLRTFENMEHDQQGYATTNALQAVIDGLQALPGRKTIVLFSEGVSIPPNVQQHYRSVIHSANRANVAIYTMDAAGLRAQSSDARARDELQAAGEARVRTLGREESSGMLTRSMERTEDLLRSHPRQSLGQLAAETGGFFIENTNDASGAFRQIGQDMRFHYVLGYAPTNSQYNGHFRAIQVKVKRPGVEVFSRKGYFGVKPGATAPLLEYEAPAVAKLDLQPGPASFPIRMGVLSFPEKDRPGLVPVVVEVPARSVRYRPDPKTRDHSADFRIVVRVTDAGGREVRRLSQQYLLAVPERNLEAVRQGDILFYKEADLLPGRYTLEAVGYDAVADDASVTRSAVEVPAAESGRLRVSSLMLVKKIEQVPAAERDPKKPFAFGEAILYPNLGEPVQKSVSPAVGFFFRAYPAGSTPLSAKVEVLKGELVVGQATTALAAPDADGRVMHAGTLPVQGFAAGPYRLRVTVTDGRSRETRVASFTVAE